MTNHGTKRLILGRKFKKLFEMSKHKLKHDSTQSGILLTYFVQIRNNILMYVSISANPIILKMNINKKSIVEFPIFI